MKTKSKKKNQVNVITLGCSKNLVDSEVMMAQLRANNFEVMHQNNKLNNQIIIVNTCGFIDRAKEESINTILEYAEAKNKGYIEKLYVTGCLSQRYKDNLENEIPEVDAFFGTLELPALLSKLGADYKHELIGERVLTTSPHYAYLKISEGCNRTCSFCAIPLMRGKHISRPVEEVVAEAQKLARNGVKELMLIAQELTYYGLDFYKKRSLDRLLNELCKVEGIEWIRLHYAYPSKFPVEILNVIKEQPKICRYLDMPLQHASDKILKLMKRQITKKETEELLNSIRNKIPDVATEPLCWWVFRAKQKRIFRNWLILLMNRNLNVLACFNIRTKKTLRAMI
jgi:ribosomal protein S12 methylthiotransferase